MADMSIILSNSVISKPTTFNRKTLTNDVDIKTLEGVWYTDYRDRGRQWVLSWNLIKYAPDWQYILDVYEAQYTTRTYTRFVFDEYNIDTTVKIDISDENIRFNGGFVEGASITLTEKTPLSPIPL